MSEMKDQPAVEVRLDVPYGGGVSGTLCNDLYLPKKQGRHKGHMIITSHPLSSVSRVKGYLGPPKVEISDGNQPPLISLTARTEID